VFMPRTTTSQVGDQLNHLHPMAITLRPLLSQLVFHLITLDILHHLLEWMGAWSCLKLPVPPHRHPSSLSLQILTAQQAPHLHTMIMGITDRYLADIRLLAGILLTHIPRRGTRLHPSRLSLERILRLEGLHGGQCPSLHVIPSLLGGLLHPRLPACPFRQSRVRLLGGRLRLRRHTYISRHVLNYLAGLVGLRLPILGLDCKFPCQSQIHHRAIFNPKPPFPHISQLSGMSPCLGLLVTL
jgi:hypothetical protein